MLLSSCGSPRGLHFNPRERRGARLEEGDFADFADIHATLCFEEPEGGKASARADGISMKTQTLIAGVRST
jgi:hypothetical protein